MVYQTYGDYYQTYAYITYIIPKLMTVIVIVRGWNHQPVTVTYVYIYVHLNWRRGAFPSRCHGGAAFGAFAAGLGHGQRQHQRRAALGAEGGEPRHGAVAMPQRDGNSMGIPVILDAGVEPINQ